MLIALQESALLPSEVAALCRVVPKTVGRWAKEGRLASFCTLGGHHRYPVRDVEDFMYDPSRCDRRWLDRAAAEASARKEVEQYLRSPSATRRFDPTGRVLR